MAPLALADIVDQVLDTTAAPGALSVPELADPALSDWEKSVAYTHAWYDRMATTNVPIIEKMTIFWHNHFVSSTAKSGDSDMWDQIALFRAQALGGLQPLTQAMAIGPAMLFYLDNVYNTKWGAQQNFARELMELFTMGVGNYTETEVIEVARAWTGHGVNWDTGQYQFKSTQHDIGMKTIFGVTKNWDGPEVIDAIFTVPAKRDATAAFIVKKLWTYFAHPNPPANVLAELATTFATGPQPFQIKPLLRAMFLRPEFYSTTAKQGLVRSPVEFLVAVLKATRLTAGELHPEWWAGEMGQSLLRPPNVAGWKWNEYWLSTTALRARADALTHLHWGLIDDERSPALPQHPLAGDLSALTPTAIVNRLLTAIDLTVIPTTRTALENFITNARAQRHNWTVPMVLTLALMSPDFNLA